MADLVAFIPFWVDTKRGPFYEHQKQSLWLQGSLGHVSELPVSGLFFLLAYPSDECYTSLRFVRVLIFSRVCSTLDVSISDGQPVLRRAHVSYPHGRD